MKYILAISIALFAYAAGQPVYQNIAGTNNGNGGGQHEIPLTRLAAPAYTATNEPRGGLTMSTLPSARLISNTVAAGTSAAGSMGNTDWHTFWGQFLDHDITLVEENSAAPFNITAVPNDIFTEDLPFIRSVGIVDGAGVLQQENIITSFIDASNVYGADDARATALRSMAGGRLRVAADDSSLLPLLSEAPGVNMGSIGVPNAILRAAGDVRANENAALQAVHTLWVREHNRLADAFAADANGPCQPDNTDECLYQEARRVVIALHQVIFEQEFAARIFSGGLGASTGFDMAASAALSNEMSIVYRMGHSGLNDMIMRDNIDGEMFGPLNLNQVFFNPGISRGVEVDALLSGMSRQVQREIDAQHVDAIRNTLFMQATVPQAMDLVARNIQRGRDHGIPDLNTVRTALGLTAYTAFDFCIAQSDCDNLSTAYGGMIGDVDIFIGAIAEAHVTGGLLGETNNRIIGDQFRAFRAGDAYWYSHTTSPNPFSADEIAELRDTTLADVIFRNSPLIETLPCRVMENGGDVCTNPNTGDSSSADDSAASTVAVSAAALAATAALLF